MLYCFHSRKRNPGKKGREKKKKREDGNTYKPNKVSEYGMKSSINLTGEEARSHRLTKYNAGVSYLCPQEGG